MNSLDLTFVAPSSTSIWMVFYQTYILPYLLPLFNFYDRLSAKVEILYLTVAGGYNAQAHYIAPGIAPLIHQTKRIGGVEVEIPVGWDVDKIQFLALTALYALMLYVIIKLSTRLAIGLAHRVNPYRRCQQYPLARVYAIVVSNVWLLASGWFFEEPLLFSYPFFSFMSIINIYELLCCIYSMHQWNQVYYEIDKRIYTLAERHIGKMSQAAMIKRGLELMLRSRTQVVVKDDAGLNLDVRSNGAVFRIYVLRWIHGLRDQLGSINASTYDEFVIAAQGKWKAYRAVNMPNTDHEFFTELFEWILWDYLFNRRGGLDQRCVAFRIEIAPFYFVPNYFTSEPLFNPTVQSVFELRKSVMPTRF